MAKIKVEQVYRTMSANEDTRTVLLFGWQVKAVFVEPDHAELGALVAKLLNRHEARKASKESDIPK